MTLYIGGPTPLDGDSAYQIAVNNGFVGTETQWLASLVGAQGLDNFQLAQQNGFTGTLAQWLASLVGPPGPPGSSTPASSTQIITYDFGFGTSAVENINVIYGSYIKIGSLVTVACTFGASNVNCKFKLPFKVKHITPVYIARGYQGGSTAPIAGFTVPAQSQTCIYSSLDGQFGIITSFTITYITDQ